MLSCKRIKKLFSILLIACVGLTTVCPPALAQSVDINFLPVPGQMVNFSRSFTPLTLKGVQPNPDNPFELDFIVDAGDTGLSKSQVKDQSLKLVKYFLAALTVPEDEQWVNLAPKEKDRVAPEALGVTVMGKDLLAQDYLLKQITASLVNPDKDLGRRFWDEVYAKVRLQFGEADMPQDLLSRVWIVPEKAVVYEHDQSAFVVERKLKVMMEEDYLERKTENREQKTESSSQSSEMMRSIILPAIEKEVNAGENFATLRQIYDSMILATWYKKRLKKSILNQVYSNQNKTPGVDVADKDIKQKIYNRYLQAFKKGVFNFIREEYDPRTQSLAPRKYFSGGTEGVKEKDLAIITADAALNAEQMGNLPVGTDKQYRIKVALNGAASDGKNKDQALLGFGKKKPDVVQITKEDLEETKDIAHPIDRNNGIEITKQAMANGLKGIDYVGENMGIFANVTGKNLQTIHDGKITLMNELVVSDQPNIGIYTGGFDELGAYYKHNKFFGAAFAIDKKGRLGVLLAPFKTLDNYIVFENDRLLFAAEEEGMIVDRGWGYFLTQKMREEYFPGKKADEITKEDIKEVVLVNSRRTKARALDKQRGSFAPFSEKVDVMWVPLKFGFVGTPAQYRWNQAGFFMKNMQKSLSNFNQTRKLFSFLHTHSTFKYEEKEKPIVKFLLERFPERKLLSWNSPGDIGKMFSIPSYMDDLSEEYWGVKTDSFAPYSIIYTHARDIPMDVSIFMLSEVYHDQKDEELFRLTEEARQVLHDGDEKNFEKVAEFYRFISNSRYTITNQLPKYIIGDQAMVGNNFVQKIENGEQKTENRVGGIDQALLGFGKKKPEVLKITKEDLNETQDAVYPINSVDDISRVMAAGLGPNGINYSGEYAGFFGNFTGNNLREVNGITLMNELVVPENQPVLGIYTEGFDEIGTYEHDEFFGAAFAVDNKGRLGILLAPFKNLDPYIAFENNRLLFATKEEGLVVSKSWGHFLTQKARETYFDGKSADEITEEDIKTVVSEYSQKAKAKVLNKTIGEFTSYTEKVDVMWMPLKFGLVGSPAQYRWNQAGFFMKNMQRNQSVNRIEKMLMSFMHTHSTFKYKELEDPLVRFLLKRYSQRELLMHNSPGDLSKMFSMPFWAVDLFKMYGMEEKDVFTPYSVIFTHDKRVPMDVSVFMINRVIADGRYDDLFDLTESARLVIHNADVKNFDAILRFNDLVSKYTEVNKLPEYVGSDRALLGSSVQDAEVGRQKTEDRALKTEENRVGGIDVNPAFMDLEIENRESKIENRSWQVGPMPKVDGLAPVILNIQALVPAQVPMLLGFMPHSSDHAPVQVVDFQEGIPGEDGLRYRRDF